MRKILLGLGILLVAGAAHADFRQKRDNGILYPGFYTYPVAVGPYTSSVTCNNTNQLNQGVIISTYGSIVHTVSISSAGIGNSMIQLFDSALTTGAAGIGAAFTAPIVRPLISPINGNGANIPYTFVYDVEASSGITIRNYGDTLAPCTTVTYTFKQ